MPVITKPLTIRGNEHRISFTQCLHSFLNAEESRWNRVLTHSLDEDGSPTQVTPTSAGNIILSHASTVENIHDYFSQLDARICRTRLTRSGCRRTFSNVRLVGQKMKDESVEEGAMMRQIQERGYVDKLEDEDFQVYRDAVLCAYFPKLCAPDPPATPHSPLQGPRHVFTFTIDEESATPMLHNDPAWATEEDDGTSSLIQAETLCDILRKAFRLSEERAKQYDRVAFSRFSKKTQPKVLAEELVSQLSVLETNKHPYYNPKAFIQRNAYDQWQQWARQHITLLLGKFWQNALPAPVTLHTESLQGKHEEYRLLMKKLLGYESVYQTPQDVRMTNPRNPLSSASRRLLKEFGLRYGVGEMYRKLVYLEYLTENFTHEPWHIQHVITHLLSIVEMLPSSRNRIIMTEDEHQLLVKCCNWLHGQCENSLTRIKRLFPENRPPEGVALLIQLLHKVIQLKSYLSGEDHRPVEAFLIEYALQGIRTAYERHKMLVSYELMMNAFDNSLSPELLNMVLCRVMDEVVDYKNNYAKSFENHFDIAREAAVEFYKLLMDDVAILCEDVLKVADPDTINHLVLSLAYNLHQLDKEWAEYIPQESQSWHYTFLPQSLLWLSTLRSQMQKLILKAVSQDKFSIVILPPDADLTPRSSVVSAAPRPRSSSMNSLSPSANSAFSSRVPSSTSCIPREISNESSIHVRHNSFQEPTPVQQQPVIKEARESHPPPPQNINEGPHIKEPGMQFASTFLNNLKVQKEEKSEVVMRKKTKDKKDSLKDILSFAKGHGLKPSFSSPDLSDLDLLSSGLGAKDPEFDNLDEIFSKSLPGNCKLDVCYGYKDLSLDEEEKLLQQHRLFWYKHRHLKTPKRFSAEAEGERLGRQLVDMLAQRVRSSDYDVAKCPKSRPSVPKTEAKLKEHGDPWSSEKNIACSPDCPEVSGNVDKVLLHGFKSQWESSDEEEDATINANQDFQFFEDLFKLKQGALTAQVETGKATQGQMTNGLTPRQNSDAETIKNQSGHNLNRVQASSSSAIGHANMNGEVEVPKVQSPGGKPEGNKSQVNGYHTPTAQRSEVHKPSLPHHKIQEAENATQTRPTENAVANDSNGVYKYLGAQHGMNPVLTSEILLPISSSFLDMFITIHRYVQFNQFLFDVLLPLPRNPTHKSKPLNPLFVDILAGREKIYEKFVKGLCNTLCVYSDNIVCLDLCSVSIDMSNNLLGKTMTDHLCDQRDSGLIWGCRHLIEDEPDCYKYVNRRVKYLADRFEPVTQEMCCRVNILSTILKLLPKFRRQAKQIANLETMKKLLSKSSRSVSSLSQLTESLQDFEYIASYSSPASCSTQSNRNTPCDAPINGQPESCELGEDLFQTCQDHVSLLMGAQIQLLAYRINLFLKEALSLLLSLDMPRARIEDRLKPVIEFLGNYVKQMNSWLYSELYNKLLEEMWTFIVKDFQEEVDHLIQWEKSTKTKAEIILQAVSFFIKFMSTDGRSLSLDHMMEQMDRVMFLLQLYTQPSERLIALYHQLYEQDSHSETSSISDDHLPPRYLQLMKHDLHLLRKCFSGEDIIQWIMKHPHHSPHQIDGVSDGSSEDTDEQLARDVAENLCQKLLDDDVIVGLDDADQQQGTGFYRSVDNASDVEVSYPRMTRCPADDSITAVRQSHDEEMNADIDQPWNDGHERQGVWTPFFWSQGLARTQDGENDGALTDNDTVKSRSSPALTASLQGLHGSVEEKSGRKNSLTGNQDQKTQTVFVPVKEENEDLKSSVGESGTSSLHSDKEESIGCETDKVTTEISPSEEGTGVSPDVGQVSPDVGKVSPDVAKVSPDVAEVSPDVAEVSPDVAKVSPDVAEVSQNVQVSQRDAVAADVCLTDSVISQNDAEIRHSDLEVKQKFDESSKSDVAVSHIGMEVSQTEAEVSQIDIAAGQAEALVSQTRTAVSQIQTKAGQTEAATGIEISQNEASVSQKDFPESKVQEEMQAEDVEKSDTVQSSDTADVDNPSVPNDVKRTSLDSDKLGAQEIQGAKQESTKVFQNNDCEEILNCDITMKTGLDQNQEKPGGTSGNIAHCSLDESTGEGASVEIGYGNQVVEVSSRNVAQDIVNTDDVVESCGHASVRQDISSEISEEVQHNGVSVAGRCSETSSLKLGASKNAQFEHESSNEVLSDLSDEGKVLGVSAEIGVGLQHGASKNTQVVCKSSNEKVPKDFVEGKAEVVDTIAEAVYAKSQNGEVSAGELSAETEFESSGDNGVKVGGHRARKGGKLDENFNEAEMKSGSSVATSVSTSVESKGEGSRKGPRTDHPDLEHGENLGISEVHNVSSDAEVSEILSAGNRKCSVSCKSQNKKLPKGCGDMLSSSSSSGRSCSEPDSLSNENVNLAGSYRSASNFGPFAPRYVASSTATFSSIFQPTKQNLYRFKSIQDIGGSVHSLTESYIQELTNHSRRSTGHLTGSLLQSAIDKEVKPQFLLTILYTRRKHDRLTRRFFDHVPVEMVTNIKMYQEKTMSVGCF